MSGQQKAAPWAWNSMAVLSPCEQYRYWLRRDGLQGIWSGHRAVFVMLNPSTADAIVDDPTIRRCKGFAKREGCSEFVVVNLFSARASKPKALYEIVDPIGPQSDDAIEVVEKSDACPIICAWGACPSGAPAWFKELRKQRIATVSRIGTKNRPLFCLGNTSDGSPRHPLYVRAITSLKIFEAPS